ncbi:MAG TPA: GNAT family N-acetyltransferase [Caulobacteraceae bacterium]
MLCTTEGLGPKCVSPTIRRGPVVETARLTLRPVQAADAPRIAALANDLGVARMTSSIPHPFPRAAADSFVAKAAGADLAREAVFAIEAEDGDLAGILGFHPKGGTAPELGYWLGRPYRGRGYMTEAVNGALDWVRDEWGKRYVVAGHFADNPQSGQVLIKAGFLYTGEVLMTPSAARGESVPTRMMVWLA